MTRPVLSTLMISLLAAPAHAGGKRQCFSVDVRANSPGTRAVFESRGCQAGGVTWAALLRVLTRRAGKVVPVDDPPEDWTGDVSAVGKALFSIDEEGDAAQFCSDDASLLKTTQEGYKKLNHDEAELRRAMGESTAMELECFATDAGAPRARRKAK
jgi:hypothetical protein